MSEPIRLLIADDSEVFVEALTERLREERDIVVAGVAGDGLQAVQLVEQLRPDVITMDVHMPGLDGLGAIGLIMSSTPTPILVLTGDSKSRDQQGVFGALTRGALDLAEKPRYSELYAGEGRRLCEKLRLLSKVTVVHHPRSVRNSSTLAPSLLPRREAEGVVVIGSSTGGPALLAQILGMLPADYPLPIAVAQHMTKGFVGHFCQWLAGACRLPVEEATLASRLRPGHVLVAPEDRHLSICADGSVCFTLDTPEIDFCPSADILFRSAARHFGSRTIGIVLSGMGRDGAEGVCVLHDAGATTIAQDGETCAVDGMPAAARSTGKVTYVLAPSEIGMMLQCTGRDLAGRSSRLRDELAE